MPVLLLAMLSAACFAMPGGGGPRGIDGYHAYDRPAKLPTKSEDVRVFVSLIRQRTYVVEGDKVLLVMPVGVGRAETPTPTGDFRILRKDAAYRERTHGFAVSGNSVKRTLLKNKPAGSSFVGSPLPFYCEFMPSLGFHTGWVRHVPSTNGSIRMHENVAPKFFRLVSVGTPVNIAYAQPLDEKHGHIPLPPDAGPLADYPNEIYLGDGYFKQHKEPVFQ